MKNKVTPYQSLQQSHHNLSQEDEELKFIDHAESKDRYETNQFTMMGTDDVKPKMNIFQKQFKEEDFDNKKNNNFFGGLFNKKSSRNHGLGKGATSGKIVPKSDDEGEIQRFELQQMLDMPDDLLR